MSVVGVLVHSTQSISGGIRDKERNLSEQLKTDIEIINDPGDVHNAPVIIYVKNVGSSTLDYNLTTVILDGQVIDAPNVSMVGSGSRWEPATVIEINIDTTLAAGDHTVTVATSNGIKDSLQFNI